MIEARCCVGSPFLNAANEEPAHCKCAMNKGPVLEGLLNPQQDAVDECCCWVHSALWVISHAGLLRISSLYMQLNFPFHFAKIKGPAIFLCQVYLLISCFFPEVLRRSAMKLCFAVWGWKGVPLQGCSRAHSCISGAIF